VSMNRCYCCGDPGTRKMSCLYICNRHYMDFLTLMCQKPSDVKSFDTPTQRPEACNNLKNTDSPQGGV